MLPTAFYDVTRLREIGLETWRSILTAAGEPERVAAASSHDALWHSLTTNHPGDALIDALEVVNELGTDAGRDLLLSAADDRQAQLGAVDHEPAGELAARIWLQSRTSTPLAEVLMRARLGAYEASQVRPYREFVGESALAVRALDRWCRENGKSEAIEVYVTESSGEWRCEVLRGEAAKRVLEIKNSHPEILNYRPGVADHLRYDVETGRLGIATRSPRLLRMYREVLGSILSGSQAFFSNENICTLKPLQQHRRSLFDRQRVPGILGVDVVELRWRRGDRDKVWVTGPDCFRILDDLHARLIEGELVQARLLVCFAGVGRRGQVTITVPGRIEINAGAREHLVERLLDEAGIRGAFGPNDERLDLWSLYPWRLREEVWRRHLGPDAFDRLVRQKAFRPERLEAVPHPDHPAVEDALAIEELADGTIIGRSADSAVGTRTLTSSDVMGYELDLSWMVNDLSVALGLEGTSREVTNGIWFIGQRTLSPSATVAVFLATRQPSDTATASVRAASGTARPVLLVPFGRGADGDSMQVECRVPHGPHEGLLGRMVETLNLRDHVPPFVYRREDLIIDPKKGEAWYRGVQLTKLSPDTHPYRFAVRVAQAKGGVVTKEDLREYLSSNNPEEGIVRKAKSDFVKKVEESFKAANSACPPDVNDLFKAQSGRGYVLKGTAHILS
jgi:hypothetical protein